jgi:glycosyltransferase involved in cell wall biosynthesis
MNILVTSIVDLKKASHNSRLHQFLNHLSKNHTITVLCINDHWKGRYDEKAQEYKDDFSELFDRITVVYLTEKTMSPILQEIMSVASIGRTLKELPDPEIDVHLNYNSLISGYGVAKSLGAQGVGTVYDIADDLPAMVKTSAQIPDPLKSVAGWVGGRVLQKNIGLAERITLTAPTLGHSYRIPARKVEVLPNGVDTETFRAQDAEEVRECHHINGCFVVGHVGVMREWLDFRPLFMAIKRMAAETDVKLLLVGAGSEFQRTQELADECGIRENVVFTGTIPYSQIPQYISSMDACVVPFAHDEVAQNSLPLKLFEYMACERPVISTSIDAVQAAFQGSVLFADDTDQYYAHLMHLKDDPTLRDELGANGRGIVENQYQWDAISHRLEQICAEVSVAS